MKSPSLSEWTTEELKKNEKGLRIANIALGFCVGVMCLTGGYMFVKKGFSTSTLMPLLFLPLLVINYMQWKKIKTEITSREKH
ncbi:MAG: hypothetical protein SFU21_04640 [Flavihumibacter sp.]|nr:hypothetical protein [Flavihumibacter sp.]